MNNHEIQEKLSELEIQLGNTLSEIKLFLPTDLRMHTTLFNFPHRILMRLMAFQEMQEKDSTIFQMCEENPRVKDVVDYVRDRKSYNPLNFFVALRISFRKMLKIQRTYSKYKSRLMKIGKEYNRLLKMSQEEKYNTEIGQAMISSVLAQATAKETIQDIDYLANRYTHHFFDLIGSWFQFHVLTKDELLNLITIDHDLVHWDGEPNRTRETIKNMPLIIDYEAFQKLIFIRKIEHDQDCYLMDQYMAATFEVMDKHPGMTWKIFEEVTGKKLQTYTVEQDEWGEVLSITPNEE